MSVLRGSCLCGAVRYELDDALLYSGYCHCSQCRKFSGAASSAFGGVEAGRFQLLTGEEAVSAYPKSADSVMHFCAVCGSSLYVSKPNTGMVHLRLGTLDDTPSLTPQAHTHVSSKAAWEQIADTLPQFDTVRPRR